MTESSSSDTDVAAIAAATAITAVVVVVDDDDENKKVAVMVTATATVDSDVVVEEGEKEEAIKGEEVEVEVEDNNMNSIFHGDFPSDIHEKYIILHDEILGKGSFGTVRKCSLKNNVDSNSNSNSNNDSNSNSNNCFALKTINKSKLPDPIQLRREVDILLDVNHPHIIKLYDVYEDEINIYLVSELCSGGELYDRVIEKTSSKEGHFTEFTAARIIKNILSAIQYCHDVKHIVHRDLKPENFLLTDKTDDAQVKVIDFGLSRYSNTANSRMHSEVGTIYYVAPEVLFGDYTDKADIWSIGVVTYVLLCGYPPFNAGTESLTYNILTEDGANVKFPSPAWDSITPDAIAFIKRLLDKDPDRRPSAKDALDDEWLSSEHVHPSSKKENWHGTFLNVFSPEAQAVPIENSVIHVEKSKQDSYHRMLHALKHWKGQQNNNNDSLRNKNISNSLNNKNNINNSNSSSRRNNNNNNGHNRNNSRDSDFNIRNLFRKKSTSDDL